MKPEVTILHPVILPVPDSWKPVMGRKKVRFLSAHARQAAMLSARFSGVTLGALEKNNQGVPLPTNGIYWSITHKPLYVGGVVSDFPVGMDIEQIRAVTPGLYKKVADQAEWDMGNQKDETLFFRYWTAKEAVIKTMGTGIKDMLRCRVVALPDPLTLIMECNARTWVIAHHYFHGHMASIVRDNCHVQWSIC
jgi:4'-phosphopantetheinyl transferase